VGRELDNESRSPVYSSLTKHSVMRSFFHDSLVFILARSVCQPASSEDMAGRYPVLLLAPPSLIDVLFDMKVMSRHFPCAQDFPNLAHLR
jgi:hypothetical protein